LIATNASRHYANPAFQKDAFQSILETSEKIKTMCNSLRTFSATLAANKDWHDPNEVLRSVTEDFSATTGRLVQLELGAVPSLLIDREEIVRLVHNLILNAHEASRDHGIIRVTSTVKDRNVVISVADTGNGISQQFLKEGLFQPFHTTKPDGLGIGLFHSKKIVEAHAGIIEVKSKVGRGTIIRVSLPVPAEIHRGDTIHSEPVTASYQR
jgi:signal transduction histidine kinase